MKNRKHVDFTHKNITYKIGDCILVRGAGAKLPFVGQIRDVKIQGKSNQIRLQVAWFYRPEDAAGGRKLFHGEKELLKSEHLDWCSASTIEGKCRVHSLQSYQALPRVTEADFYARFTYKPESEEFSPDRVPVYCLCEMPYNPDSFMILCSKCEDWYHPKCVNLTKTQCKKMVSFECPVCKQGRESVEGREGVQGRETKRRKAGLSANGSHTGA
ncbi:BAH-domain-containing protein [Coccomyxa subellipsoidea C-169]|uniref:BAH-domain-containing protein n=1 Tax=Coccomyxa subellipsoidea (strain C-169) TaxID=574566 RepID=I0YIE7_COCSC|nr:BAH-domain-containing protein [Coccomyxa subellipsoidea C-169]EIE18166.1 BAH-domain-containing protein [Coccomyxa subellipsoidea C-169]|eukprot:XP_005642710.1 BAH-domain-containing protein [Coccomyxa subellipsoidea C-169]